MPTGYTAKIQDGCTFQEYALSCARAFGALILMRDDPNDAPIPDVFKPSDHHTNELRKAKKELARLRAMTEADREVACNAANASSAREHIEYEERKDATRAKYEAMLEQVKAYMPPTPDHQGYKDFMVKQIEDSIDFDCPRGKPWKGQTTGEWYNSALERAERSVSYHLKEADEEQRRASERSAWVQDLKRSLGLKVGTLVHK